MYITKSGERLLDKCKGKDAVVIVGASDTGKEVLNTLKSKDLVVECFFDNSDKLCGSYLEGVPIVKPCRLQTDKSILYVIASVNYTEELYQQLLSLGIKAEKIEKYYQNTKYEYYATLEEEYYEAEMQQDCFKCFGKYIDVSQPLTYNERILFEKIRNDKDERKTLLSDKYLVREWVTSQIGEKYLTQLIGVWEDADEIDFSKLPAKYVLKLNHGCGWNIIVTEKLDSMEESRIRKQLNQWKNINFAYYNLEMQYKNIKPRIICEEYLENEKNDLYDYKVFCFHGEPTYIMFAKGRTKDKLQRVFYNTKWEKQDVRFWKEPYDGEVLKPRNLEEMLEMSKILSKGFSHVRVDWYVLSDDTLKFGEMTFTSNVGTVQWEPPEYDRILGDLIERGNNSVVK